MNAEQSIYVPKDIWREILRNLYDYRSCLAVNLTSKSFRKIINDRFKIAEHYKDLMCVVMGPEKSGKMTLLAKLGLLLGLFEQDSEDESLLDSLWNYWKDQPDPVYTKCEFLSFDSIGRNAIIHYVRQPEFVYMKTTRLEVVIFAISYQQAIEDLEQSFLKSVLNSLRLRALSKVLVVISHTGDTTAMQNSFADIRRKYTEVYEQYKQHWHQLQMEIVPVDSVTGWNILPHASDSYKGLSFWETLRRFHADGCPINGPWRVCSVDVRTASTIQAYVLAGELRAGDLLINSEIAREIEEISIDGTIVESAWAQRSPITLKLKGSSSEQTMDTTSKPISKRYIYGPGVKYATRLVARIVFFALTKLPLKEVKLRSLIGAVDIISFKVLSYLDPITYEPVPTSIDDFIPQNEIVLAEIEISTPICIESESSYPDLAMVHLTIGSSLENGALLAVGMMI